MSICFSTCGCRSTCGFVPVCPKSPYLLLYSLILSTASWVSSRRHLGSSGMSGSSARPAAYVGLLISVNSSATHRGQAESPSSPWLSPLPLFCQLFSSLHTLACPCSFLTSQSLVQSVLKLRSHQAALLLKYSQQSSIHMIKYKYLAW